MLVNLSRSFLIQEFDIGTVIFIKEILNMNLQTAIVLNYFCSVIVEKYYVPDCNVIFFVALKKVLELM